MTEIITEYKRSWTCKYTVTDMGAIITFKFDKKCYSYILDAHMTDGNLIWLHSKNVRVHNISSLWYATTLHNSLTKIVIPQQSTNVVWDLPPALFFIFPLKIQSWYRYLLQCSIVFIFIDRLLIHFILNQGSFRVCDQPMGDGLTL